MPWKDTSVVNQRTEFVLKALQGKVSFLELCREYGISRKTGYKWKKRFVEDGLDGLADHSRRPSQSPSQVDEDTVCKIVRLKTAHPDWGPRKIRTVFGRTYSDVDLPSDSSFKRILDKAGLVKHRKRRPQSESGRIANRVQAESPNDVWTVDFKGWWRTADRSRFEPLTIRDAYSRYILCARALANARSDTVRLEFERVFGSYGLPKVIRSDNGTPFAATRAPLGLSRLSAWWIALGIDLDRIPPARPDQNGAHERMHRDISMELECNAADDVTTQQAALDTWRNEYNHERPHEAIEMKCPAEMYSKSSRRFDQQDIELTYPMDFLKRRVSKRGTISIDKTSVSISEALAGWDVGLQPSKPSNFDLWFCQLRLGHVEIPMQKFYQATANSGKATVG